MIIGQFIHFISLIYVDSQANLAKLAQLAHLKKSTDLTFPLSLLDMACRNLSALYVVKSRE